MLRYIFDPAEPTDLRNEARSLFFPRGSKVPVWCSGAALGELVWTLKDDTARQNRKKDFSKAMVDLEQYLDEGWLQCCMFLETQDRAFEIAHRISSRDWKLKPTDSLIVGCFLADPLCSVLYVADEPLRMSEVIIKELQLFKGKNIKGLAEPD